MHWLLPLILASSTLLAVVGASALSATMAQVTVPSVLVCGAAPHTEWLRQRSSVPLYVKNSSNHCAPCPALPWASLSCTVVCKSQHP